MEMFRSHQPHKLRRPTFKGTRAMLAALVLALGLVPAEGKRPDILLLVADDLGWNDVGWHNPEMRTPHLDRLVREGIELHWHYVQPQCTPTRVALLTGRYPSRFGPHCTVAANEQAIPFETTTLPKVLAEHGYRTGLFGKWHLGSLPKWGPNHFGFHHSYGSLAGACGIWDHRYRLNRPPYTETWHRNHTLVTEEGHSLELCTREAIRWVDALPASQPVFCYMPYHAVHTPLAEKDRKWFEMNDHIRDADRQHFAAYVSHLDDAVHRLVEAFRRTGRLENTIIIFTSDNGGVTRAYRGGAYPKPDPFLKQGFSSNKPLRGGKSTSYEGGIRVPAFVCWPKGLAQPHRSKAIVHATDWFPTLLAAAGIAAPGGLALDGRAMDKQLQDPEAAGQPRTIYTTWNGLREVSIRHGAWKIRAGGKGTQDPARMDFELYNLARDPHETSNLAREEPKKLRELVALFESERAKDGNVKIP